MTRTDDLKEFFGQQIEGLKEYHGALIDGVNKRLDDLTEQKKTQNGRIGKLENWQYLITGGVVVINFIVLVALHFYDKK